MKKREKEKNPRGAGILLPVSSLPSPYGIGTFGETAYRFVDQLERSGQKYWQVLPLGPVSYGDSPYQSFSAFAGNPYYIDLDFLCREGLLRKAEYSRLEWGEQEDQVDYEGMFRQRYIVLKKAFTRWNRRRMEQEELQQAFGRFQKEQNYWLNDYCCYMTCKEWFEHREWSQWPEEYRFRRKKAIKELQEKREKDLLFWGFCQFKFYEQWNALKKYANKKGVRIIGDIPLYVAYDSADVWVHGDLFELDQEGKPVNVAGVPPDYFSEDGQRWGNPLYDWEKMKEDGYDWWHRRMEAQSGLFDVIRIDHFIGISRYYAIPASCETAREGCYRKGPGRKLTDVMKEAAGRTQLIAEDLGVISKGVRKLIKSTGFPSMKVLLFAFDSDSSNEYLPHNYTTNHIIVYGGTHDNETIAEHFQHVKGEELKRVLRYLGVSRRNQIPLAMLKLAYQTVGDRVIFQMQDLLGLGAGARMNLPGVVGGNWRWRMKAGEFTEELERQLWELTKEYNR